MFGIPLRINNIPFLIEFNALWLRPEIIFASNGYCINLHLKRLGQIKSQ